MDIDMSQEIWKDIPGYEGYYQVSNLGNVQSLDRLIPYKDKTWSLRKGRLLSQRLYVSGYLVVHLYKNNQNKDKKVHQLVASAFLTKDKYRNCVNHIDGNKLNNKLSNLEYLTNGENIKHAWDSGLMSHIHKERVGEKHHRSKITNEQARMIKILIKDYTIKEVSFIMNCPFTTVYNIKANRTWKHI